MYYTPWTTAVVHVHTQDKSKLFTNINKKSNKNVNFKNSPISLKKSYNEFWEWRSFDKYM